MPVANSYAKQLRIAPETAWDTEAVRTGGTILRRVTSSFTPERDVISSAEKLSSYQIRSSRHGAGRVTGRVRGELSATTYADLLASLVSNTWQTAPTSGALITISSAVSGNTVTLTRGAGSFLADGFKIGMVIEANGWTAPAVANNNHRLHVTNVAALTITAIPVDGRAYIAKAAGDSVTVLMPGRHTFIPATGHVNPSFTVEEWYPDVPFSDVFVGARVASMNLTVPTSGVVTADFAFMARRYLVRDVIPQAQAYFTTPAAETTGEAVASSSGVLVVQGVPLPLMTNFTLTLDKRLEAQAVAFSNLPAFINPQALMVSGSITPLLSDATLSMRQLFRDELEGTISFALADSRAADADAIAITLPRVKINSDGLEEGNTNLPMTQNFEAIENTAGGVGFPTERTTILIQDTSLV